MIQTVLSLFYISSQRIVIQQIQKLTIIMRFHLITHLTKTAIVQPQRRRVDRQCRTWHHRTRATGVSEISSRYAIPHRCYSSESSSDSAMGLLSWYLRMLEKRPVLTKSVSSAIIYVAADITSQHITMESNDKWDSTRTLRMAGFGLLILGPVQHMWFGFVARLLPKRDVLTTFKKLAMGQLFFGPTINGVFFSFNAGLQGESRNEIAARLKRDLIPTLLNGLMYWPMCDFFTYKVVPVHLQPLLNSSFSYLWTIYITYMASLGKAALD